MTDMNETQWWKKYVPDQKIVKSEIDEDKKIKKLSDVWQDMEVGPDVSYKYDYKPNLSKLADIASRPETTGQVLDEILDVVNNCPYYELRDADLRYTIEAIEDNVMQNPNIIDSSLENIKEAGVGGFENIILTHKDCTEKDLIEVAKKTAVLEWKLNDDLAKPQRKPYKVGELNMWGKIFMDPKASDELKQTIVEHGLNKNHNDWFEITDRIRQRAEGIKEEPDVLDYYLKRDDCPKEFFVPAVQDCMGEYFHKYIRNTEYYVDAEKLNEVVAHPNMTVEAFKEALYIVREDMVEPAEDPEDADWAGHYRGENDTCDLSLKDKQQILKTMLKNPACTPEIAVDIFEAAKKTGLLGEIREFAQEKKLFPEAEKQMEERLAKAARQDEIDNALARVHQKHEDLLTVKKSGDIELNKAVMLEKVATSDMLARKVEGKTQLNKTIMKLAKLRRETQQE